MWGIRRHALRHRRRRRPAPVPRRLPRRPADRPRGARSCPHLRVRRAPLPWEALLAAITRAADRVRARGRDPAPADRRARPARCPRTGLRDAPVARRRRRRRRPHGSPRSTSRPTRALTLRRAAARGRAGRVDLLAARPAAGLAPRCARSPASARGRWRCSRSTARATTTASPPATSATSSSSAASRPATRGRAPTSPRCARSSRPTASWKGLAGEYLRRRAARGWLPLSPARARRAGRAPRPARNSFVSTCSAVCRCLIRPLVEHPVGVALPLRRVLVAERPVRVGGEEDRQRRLDRRLLQAAVEPGVGLEQRVDARPRDRRCSAA